MVTDTKPGHDEIVFLIGASGMGEVCLTRNSHQRPAFATPAAPGWCHEFNIKAWLYCVLGEEEAS